MLQVTLLPNSLTVLSAEMPHMTSVSLGLWVGVGGRYERPEENGASHFIEHMLFKGTRRRSAKRISQEVEGAGGYMNAFTSEENTCFYSKALGDRMDVLLDVVVDMFTNSRFDPTDIDKERAVIKEEWAMYQDQPQQRVQELLNEVTWPRHPLGWPLTGTPRTLDRFDRRKLLEFKRANYVAGCTLLVAAGRVSHRHLVRLVRGYERRFADGRRPAFLPAPPPKGRPRCGLVTKDTEQTQLALGIHTCARRDDRRYPLRLLNTILGESMSSRLFQTIREDLGLAYSVHSGLSYFDDAGNLTISAGLDTEKLPRVLRLIVAELRRLRRRAPSSGELQRAKDYVLGQIDLSLENTESQMMSLGEQWLGHGRLHSPARVKRRLASVSAGEVLAVARDFFRPERLDLALVSPIKSTRHLLPLLDFST